MDLGTPLPYSLVSPPRLVLCSVRHMGLPFSIISLGADSIGEATHSVRETQTGIK